MPKIAALIPAAGQGQRLGLGPKAYLPLGTASILRWVLRAFEGEVDETVIAVYEDMLATAGKHTLSNTRVIEGGKTRQATVYKLLKATEADIVLIHDAARPFLSSSIIQQSIKCASSDGAVTVARAVADSLVDKKTGQVVDRSALLAIQTPQSFQKEVILKAHELALSNNVEATDDAALVRQMGQKVSTIEGNSWLMKITTPADYQLAQILVSHWTPSEV